jgi:hypothetical protein
MNEKIVPIEKGRESFPNPIEAEVVDLFEKFLKGNGYAETKREEDGTGLTKLEVLSHDDEGNPISCVYTRRLKRSDGTPSRITIDIEYYDEVGGYPIDVRQVALFKDGEWIEQN